MYTKYELIINHRLRKLGVFVSCIYCTKKIQERKSVQYTGGHHNQKSIFFQSSVQAEGFEKICGGRGGKGQNYFHPPFQPEMMDESRLTFLLGLRFH